MKILLTLRKAAEAGVPPMKSSELLAACVAPHADTYMYRRALRELVAKTDFVTCDIQSSRTTYEWNPDVRPSLYDLVIRLEGGIHETSNAFWSYENTYTMQPLYKVNKRYDALTREYLYGVTGGRTGEGMLSVTAGLAYKFNRRGFVRASNVQPVDVTPYLDRIRNLEENNTDLASKNSVLNDENEKLRNAPAKVVVEQKVSASPVVLFFRIGKATLDSKELTNLEFYVRNAMKLDSDKTFTLIGSADKDTGNRELNQRLSEQRMEYVYDLLKNKYGVAPERLVRKAEGDTNNRFAEPELNRAVIVE